MNTHSPLSPTPLPNELNQVSVSLVYVFLDVRSHLGAGTTVYIRFLTLLQQILFNNDNSHPIEQSVLDIAEILKACPRAFYQLNKLFHPQARVEFNIRHFPLTSFVLKTPNSSQIVVLSGPDDHLSLNTLSSVQLRDILACGKSRSHTDNGLQAIADPALQDCLAQLAQDLLDDPETPKLIRRRALEFLRRGIGVPPSLLLHELIQHDMFACTTLSDLYEGTVGNIKVIIKKPRVCKGSLNNKEIIREITLCRQFCHPNILPFQGVSFDAQDQLYGLVTRFMKNGNIVDFLKHNPDTNRLTCVWQIMNGLRFLHGFDPPVSHRDIKGANILVDDNFVCCLCDFGLSSIPELSQRSREQAVGTFSWMPPEMLSSPIRQIDPFKADIYALAITVIEIYAGEPPSLFYGCASRCPTHTPAKEVLSIMLTDTYTIPSDLSELISMMLDHNPLERPPIGVIFLAVEDNLEFPKRITDTQGSFPPTSDLLGHSFAKPLAREWVQRELEREKKSVKSQKSTAKRASLQRVNTPHNRVDASSHSYHHRGYSRHALAHIKWFWAMREEHWEVECGPVRENKPQVEEPFLKISLDDPFVSLSSSHRRRNISMHPVHEPQHKLPSTTIHPRRGGPSTLRSSYCAEINHNPAPLDQKVDLLSSVQP